jgi:hypothetical protein
MQLPKGPAQAGGDSARDPLSTNSSATQTLDSGAQNRKQLASNPKED